VNVPSVVLLVGLTVYLELKSVPMMVVVVVVAEVKYLKEVIFVAAAAAVVVDVMMVILWMNPKKNQIGLNQVVLRMTATKIEY
jgi:hypothetical protein